MFGIKFNWGTGIAVFYISFVLILIGFVIFTTFNRVDLVDENYYSKELDYQNQIEKINRTGKLTEQLKIGTADKVVRLSFPKSMNLAEVKGLITFFRPSDKKLDFNLPVSIDSEGNQFISSGSLSKGMWRVKIDWAVGDSAYYNEDVLILN